MNKLKFLALSLFLISIYSFSNLFSYKDVEKNEINPYMGKKISILGDSISTYKGYVYIDSNNNKIMNNISIEFKNVWWNVLANSLNIEIDYSSSLSGSRVVNNKESNLNKNLSSVYRIKSLGKNGTPDLIIFYGATNDIPEQRKIKLGKFDKDSSKLNEVDLTSEKFDNFVDAYTTTIKRIKYYYPKSKLLVLLPTYTSTYYSDERLNKYNNEIIKICNYLDVKNVDLRKCITKDNINKYLYDGLHPNDEGMKKISDCTISALGLNINRINDYNKYLKNTID